MNRDSKELTMKGLDDAIKHVARVRQGLITMFHMPAEEVDEEINKMCEKHHAHFDGMTELDILFEAIIDAATKNPERTKASLDEAMEEIKKGRK